MRKINVATGEVTTLAGGYSGYADGTGTAALFNAPAGICSDGAGNLYLVEGFGNRVRKIVVATGQVTTVAGSGTQGHADGTGTAAQFYFPDAICYDGAGALYVSEPGMIRKIVIATGQVSTVAGSATTGFADGTGTAARLGYSLGQITTDGAGNLFVTDADNSRIRKIVAATGVVSTIAGNGEVGYAEGPGASAIYNLPVGILALPSGKLLTPRPA